MRKEHRNWCICLGFVALLLTVILVPMSFSYVEYYEYGLKKRKSTGTVYTDRVYTRGRYHLGPDYRFIKYPAGAQYEAFEQLSVFSAGNSNESIGLDFQIDVDFTYLLIQDEILDLHRELASGYRSNIESRAKDAIKNEAIFVTFTQYFQDRKEVELRFRNAVQARWNDSPSLHCTLDQFHLGRIRIPETVAEKQLESRVQNERNDMEEFIQQAKLEREQTEVQVNRVNLETEKVLRTARAESSLIQSKALSEAEQIKAEAQVNGTGLLYNMAGIETQEHMSSYTYIRTLKNRKDLHLDISYLSPESVVRTKNV